LIGKVNLWGKWLHHLLTPMLTSQHEFLWHVSWSWNPKITVTSTRFLLPTRNGLWLTKLRGRDSCYSRLKLSKPTAKSDPSGQKILFCFVESHRISPFWAVGSWTVGNYIALQKAQLTRVHDVVRFRGLNMFSVRLLRDKAQPYVAHKVQDSVKSRSTFRPTSYYSG
jgi:hypothetical protein